MGENKAKIETLQDFSCYFKGVYWRDKDHFQALCPAHDDKKASLSASFEDGKILFYCHKECKSEDILSAIGLTWSDFHPVKEETYTGFDYKNIVATYYYSDQLRKIRDGNKNFIWQHKINGRWKAGRNKLPHTLYKAGTPSDTIYIVEGEKDADNTAKHLKLYAVSSENGAGKNAGGKKWYPEYNNDFTGKTAILIPDNDEIGQEFMQLVAKEISSFADSVKVLDLKTVFPDLPKKGDISDAIKNYGADETLQRLQELIDNTFEWEEDTSLAVNDSQIIGENPVAIARDKKGNPLNTIDNYLEIMRHDPHYDSVKFNVLKNCPDYLGIDEAGHSCRLSWGDSEDALSRYYCEKHYELQGSAQKHQDALYVLLRERKYNPIHDILNSLPEWDGVERCKYFLQKWMKATDTVWTQTVGQIMFDGAIARAFDPGCKFDLAVVLIGEKTGEGKSTLVRLLALEDEFFGEIQSMSRKPEKIYEDMLGKWIIEIGEYLMKDDQAEQDSTKAFITRTADTYRTPYERYPKTLPRRCIFIGTTNHREFLTDPTSGRRWLPIICHSDGSFVGDDAEIKAEIRLCYAEAIHRFKNGQSMLTVPRELIETAREIQESSSVEDARYGIIEDYVKTVKGQYVCGIEIWCDALGMMKDHYSAKPKREINEILRKIPFLEAEDKLQYTPRYGRQRVFRITLNDNETD